ncbi:MAG: hypothetical protein F6K18_00065 [Okeania sp. SIO2C2]|nr:MULTISPECIES: hypothetical protein [Okeania]NEP07615.1 hypothetical protein [Okeania sp. SIO4D6]NET11440.1 hypothetical protein [Okeania sp. SIO1H6]NEP72810.1 hypothetical protein [Okeania sp. SIO2G5]NEP85351.1 hypothetical protein [Okeania sp. SIO2C2]NEP93597.1 hypothetical protein [Okeania sp. SIO2F5]
MLKRLAIYNQERQEIQQQSIRIGIGINTDDLMLGTVGGGKRIRHLVKINLPFI